MVKKKEEKKETVSAPASPITEYKTIRVFEEGRDYETTYTRKYEERKPWVPPDPEEQKSFIPGTVHKIQVKVGDEVKQGDPLMVFIAMKMHNVIRAPFAGKISAIHVKEGDKVPRGLAMIVVSRAKGGQRPKSAKKPIVSISKGRRRKKI